MKKIVSIVLIAVLAVALAAVSLSSCGIIDKVENAVTYPDTYSITYEITSPDGLIHTVTKTVDADGNIYFKSKDHEKLFVNDSGSYTLYEKGSEGAFLAVDDVKYTAEAVENEISLFDSYARMTTNKFIPTARCVGEQTVVDRFADTYKIGVNLFAVSFFHYYYVDQATGICLGVDVVNETFGNETKDNEETFVCTCFVTENIENLANKIKK